LPLHGHRDSHLTPISAVGKALRVHLPDQRDDLADLADRLPQRGFLAQPGAVTGIDETPSVDEQTQTPPLELAIPASSRKGAIFLTGPDMPPGLAQPEFETIVSWQRTAGRNLMNGVVRYWRTWARPIDLCAHERSAGRAAVGRPWRAVDAMGMVAPSAATTNGLSGYFPLH
jgi:hypothetical protein